MHLLFLQGLLHLEQLLHGQDMLARPDALHLVRWIYAGITGAGRREMHDILVVWNGAGRNSISIFGPRNAQHSILNTAGTSSSLVPTRGSFPK